MPPLRLFGPAVFRGNTTLLAAAAGVVASGFLAGWLSGVPGLMRDLLEPATFGYLAVFLSAPLPLVFLIGRLGVRDNRGRFVPGKPGWAEAWRRFQTGFANPGAVGRASAAAGALALVINTYGSWKRSMPTIRPFAMDEPLARLDRLLHLGTDPWQILQPWLGTPTRTLFLDTVYYTWLPVTFAAMGWLVWSRDDSVRERTLLGIVFVWIGLGNIAATFLSSAGPCFYGHLVPGPDPFAPLLQYLEAASTQVPLFAPKLQETLWGLHATGTTQLYTGISAMPSVHVAMPALYAMAGWERNRWLGAMFGVYAILILLATVQLGWHYAVDGYVSVLAVWAYWQVARRLGGPSLSPPPPAS